MNIEFAMSTVEHIYSILCRNTVNWTDNSAKLSELESVLYKLLYTTHSMTQDDFDQFKESVHQQARNKSEKPYLLHEHLTIWYTNVFDIYREFMNHQRYYDKVVIDHTGEKTVVYTRICEMV